MTRRWRLRMRGNRSAVLSITAEAQASHEEGRHPGCVPQAWDQVAAEACKESVLQEGARVAEVLRLARGAGEAIPVSAVLVRCELLLARGETRRQGSEEAIELTGQACGCRREPRASSSRPTLT